MTALAHRELTVVDGLQINNWNRTVLDELHDGGVTAVNATCAVWEGPTETLRAVADWMAFARDHHDRLVLARDTDDIRQAKRDGRVAVLLGFQNTSPFGDDYRLVEAFHTLGVRVAQLTYNIQNHVGGSCYDPSDSGLTRFGEHVVDEMNRLGMLVDLSHVGNRTSLDAIAHSAGPVAITHANPTWFVDTARNKPQEVIDALVARGGVIGACLYPNVAGGEHTTLDQFCDMIMRLVDRVGPDHVALGSDCTRNWGQDYVGWLRHGRWLPRDSTTVEPQWPTWPQWFGGPADFPVLTDGLLSRGLEDTVVAKIMGENWMCLFDTVFQGARTGRLPRSAVWKAS